MCKAACGFTWKLYKGFCFLTGTLVLLFPFLLFILFFSLWFVRTNLTNDIYLVKHDMRGDYNNVIIRNKNGDDIYRGRIWGVCFNADYLGVDLSMSPEFLYLIDEKRKLYRSDPEFNNTYRNSKLYKNGSCIANWCSGAIAVLSYAALSDKDRKRCKPILTKEE